MEEHISVKILTPQEVLFEGEALTISSTNSVGPFDILPEHANFITLTENTEIIIKKLDKTKVTFNFPLAIIYNFHNKISIYTHLQLPQINS